MNNYIAIDTEIANPKLKQQFQLVQSAFGGIPNLMKMFANAPAAMEAFTLFYKTLKNGSFSERDMEQIAIPVSASNGCEYCVAVHFFVGEHLGIDRTELVRNLEGTSIDNRTSAILQFAKELAENTGPISEPVQRQLSENKINHQQKIEILCIVYAFSLLNRLKHLTQPDLDFPDVTEFEPSFRQSIVKDN